MHHRTHRRLHALPLLALLVGGLPLLIGPAPVAAAPCGSAGPAGASPLIVHTPSLSLATVTWALAQRHSPLSANDARFLVEASQRTTIDDAFALAVWAAETQDGREAVPGTHNLGNVTAAQGVSWAGHVFASYPTWQAGIAAWFQLITQLYVHGGHAKDLVTFALFYVHGLTPQDASPAERQAVTQGYAQTLTSILTILKEHEATLHPAQPGAETSTGSRPSPHQTLLSLLPPADSLPPGWAGPGTWPAAASLPLTPCAVAGTEVPPLVQAALQLGVWLRSPTPSGLFDHWAAGAPVGVTSTAGGVWDTDFLASVYQAATGEAWSALPPAASWWTAPPGQDIGWVRVPAGPGHMPQSGDIAVLLDGAAGKVALLVGVQLPHQGHPGWMLVLESHAQHVLERWTLQTDGTLQPPWPDQPILAGYLRLPPLDPTASG